MDVEDDIITVFHLKTSEKMMKSYKMAYYRNYFFLPFFLVSLAGIVFILSLLDVFEDIQDNFLMVS
jgi:hypothetical protein